MKDPNFSSESVSEDSNCSPDTLIVETADELINIASDLSKVSSVTEGLQTVFLKIQRQSFTVQDLMERLQNVAPFSSQLTWTKAASPDVNLFAELVSKVFDSRWFTNFGALHQELEERLREFLKVKHALLVNNATIGLMLCVKYAQLRRRSRQSKDYIITTPFTFPATAHAAKFCGLRVAFADINPNTLCLDPDAVEEIIMRHGPPVAVIPVHVFGNVANLEGFSKLQERYGFYLIYDAAHCFGVEHNGKGIGSFGDFSVFSLHSTKVFHTAEGGVITLQEDSHLEMISFLRSFGIRGNDTCFDLGINAKLSEINCAIGLALWPKLPFLLSSREKLYKTYVEHLSDITAIQPVLAQDDSVKPNYAYATFKLDPNCGLNRDKLVNSLSRFNIVARKYFYPLLSDVPIYQQDVEFFATETPIARQASSGCITLPLYPDLTEQDVRRICEVLKFIFWANGINGSKGA